MKKWFGMVLVMLLAISAVTGCAGQTEEEKQTLVMATNAEFEPYEYYDGGEIVGIDVEIAQAIAEELGYTLEVEDMSFDGIISAVQSGKADMGMAGMTVTEDRMLQVSFSETYYTARQMILVREDDTEIAGAEDLTGKQIGVATGTTGDLFATEDFGEESIQRFSKAVDAVQALIQDKVDAVIIDNEVAKKFVEATEGIKMLETEYAEEEYAICFAKDNALVLEVDEVLGKLQENGTIAEIVAKYIDSDE